jgi:SMP-30/Gluconolactonase/LRE-like region
MKVSRYLHVAAVLTGVLIVAFSTTAQASPALTRVLTLSPPDLPESIAIDHQGNMYIGLPFASKVLKVSPVGTQSTVATFSASTLPLGVRLDSAGDVFVAVVGSGVWEVPAGGSLTQLVNQPGFWNGLAFDHRGNLFVSESHGGAIWRISKDGGFSMWSASSLLQGTVLPGPCGLVHPTVPVVGPIGANGIAFNKHGDLLVANTDLGTIIRIPVNPDGSAGTEGIFAGPDCNLWGADGVAMDNQDNLLVAVNSKDQIDRVDPSGNVQVIAAGDDLNFPADIAFGAGHGDRKQIFISNFAAIPTGTGAPGVLKMDVGIPGRALG